MNDLTARVIDSLPPGRTLAERFAAAPYSPPVTEACTGCQENCSGCHLVGPGQQARSMREYTAIHIMSWGH